MDEDLLRALLTEQHPDLAQLPVKEVPGGWDNQMWRLGEDLALRMPRFDRAPALQLKEHRWLPELSLRLPLPVPTPLRVGRPSDLFPRSWLVTTWVHGTPAEYAPIISPAATDVLVEFLQALHTKAPADAPVNDRSGVPRGPLGFVEELNGDRVDECCAIWADAQAAPAWDGDPVWLHGDLHPANVVVTDGNLTGVVDFGELAAGDPATDLAAAWVLLPDGEAERFFARYLVDDATVRRARGWAVARALFLIAMGSAGEKGRPGGKTHWGPLGRQALERLLSS
jgi:aminoglycoside phosphotransferase (APT) family kinase protein